MGRRPCCEKEGVNRGAWTAMEDKLLTDHINLHGEGRWRTLPKIAGLNRCGKSCRLRWLNYLRPDIKRGNITDDEEELIVRLHKLLGNRWSLIAGRLPGRTDNEIKNYWNSNLSKKINRGEDLCNVDANQNDTNKDTTSATKLPPETPNPVVFRTKAFKCTQRVRLPSPPPPPLPPPPPESYTQDPAAMGAGHNSFVESPVMDLPTMDFSMNFDEFFGPQSLPPLAEVGSELICPETGSGGGDEFSPPELPGGVFSDEMLEDWTRDDQCAFDASFLETWLGV